MSNELHKQLKGHQITIIGNDVEWMYGKITSEEYTN